MSPRTSKRSKKKGNFHEYKRALKEINNLKLNNEFASLALFLFSFVFIFTLSLFVIKQSFPEPTITYAQEPLPVVAVTTAEVKLPNVPNEIRYRASIKKQPFETTEHVKKRICEVFGDYCQEALVIALHESGYYLKATSSANAIGIFQIHCASHKRRVGGDCNRLYDLETNLQVAHTIFQEQKKTWGPWEAKRFLKDLKK